MFNVRVKAIFVLNEGRSQGLRFLCAIGPASKGHQIEQGLSGVLDRVFDPGRDDQKGMMVTNLFLLNGCRTFLLPDDQEGAAAKKEPFRNPGMDVIPPDRARFQGDGVEGSPIEGLLARQGAFVKRSEGPAPRFQAKTVRQGDNP
jgi:hypothetical protein